MESKEGSNPVVEMDQKDKTHFVMTHRTQCCIQGMLENVQSFHQKMENVDFGNL